jgi:hypothetical protein
MRPLVGGAATANAIASAQASTVAESGHPGRIAGALARAGGLHRSRGGAGAAGKRAEAD